MSRIIFDVDTQNDLCYKKNTANPKALGNIREVLIHALRNEIVIIGSVIAHDHKLYGYCTIGTEGQEKLNETMLVEPEFYYNVANTRNGIDLNVAEECWQIVFEKQNENIWDPLMGQPDNVQSFLRHENIDTVYVIGYNFHGIVETIQGLIERKYNVRIVHDAISWNILDETAKYLAENVKGLLSATCISTEQFIAEIGDHND